MPHTASSKEAELNRGRKEAIRLLNERVAGGQTRKVAAKQMFFLASGEDNETETENWFDEGVRAQLTELGHKEEK